MLSFERASELLSYNPDNGDLRWLHTKSSRAVKGAVAGNLDKNGYIRIGIDGSYFKAHRVAWLLYYGELPDGYIDHINHEKSDNRISNLRIVSALENAKNRPLQSKNRTGIMGVSRKVNGDFEASFYLSCRKFVIGCWGDFFEACCARKSIENALGYHLNYGERVDG